MSDRYEQPERGSYTDQWDIVLNRNFAEIGEDVDQLFAEKANKDGGNLTPNTVATKTKPWADVTNPEYGAVGDGATDDTQAFKDAIDAAQHVFVPHSDDGYLITDELTITDETLQGASPHTHLRFDLSSSSSSIAVHVTGIGTVESIGLNSERGQGNWDMNDPWSGLRVTGAHDVTTRNLDIYQFEYGLHLYSDGSGVGYNNHHPRRIYDCVEGVRLETSSTPGAWVNENKIEGARISLSSNNLDEAAALPQETYGVRIDHNSETILNNNKFDGISVEWTDIGFDITGYYNMILSPRTENMQGADDLDIVFNARTDTGVLDARYNQVLAAYGMGSDDLNVVYQEADGTYASDLRGNKVIARDVPLITGKINLHSGGYRRAYLEYDQTNREWVFTHNGNECARLDESGNLRIAGTITEYASF